MTAPAADLLLDVLLASTRDGVLAFDRDCRYTVWNATMEAISGMPASRVIGRNAFELFPFLVDVGESKCFEAALRGETTISQNQRFVIPETGREGIFEGKYMPLRDGAGAIVGGFAWIQDLTVQKQVEQALADERRTSEAIDRVGKLLVGELDLGKLLQALTDAATELCAAQFGSFFYNVVNTAGESYMLYTLSGVPREAFSKFPMPRNTRVFAPTFTGERVVRSDDITKDPAYGHSPPHFGMPKGHLPVHSYLAVPVTSRTGEVLGGLFFGHEQVGVFSARHEQMLRGIAVQAAIAIDNARLYQQARAAEQKAHERAEALTEAHRHKDDFLAMLAHELRNPLGAVSNAVHVMSRSKPGDSAFERSIQIAMRQIAHQRKLVDDLLDVSRIARGKVDLQREKLDLAALVRDTADDHRPAITSAGLRLDVETPDAPLVIDGDRVRIAQVVGNLLDNARKFTRPGGRIRVRVESTDTRQAVLRVVDSGIGIEPQMFPHLFSPFTQAERSLDRSQGGLGLGLALAKGLVELHDGRIDATSAGPDHGTELRVALPLAAEAVLGASPTPSRDTERHAHVLVVDDLRDAADTLRELLTLMGCTVDVAYDAKQALATLRTRRPDVVLCDLGLPGELNGYDFARVVVRELGKDAIRLVALTGYGAENDERASLEAGFALHLTKPIRPEQLDEVIGRRG